MSGPVETAPGITRDRHLKSERRSAPVRARLLRVVARIAGRFLVGAGALILLFVAFQLWGSSLIEASHQRSLRQQLDRELEQYGRQGVSTPAGASRPFSDSTPATVADSTPAPQSAGHPAVAGLGTSGLQPAVPAIVPDEGRPVGTISIPAIHLDRVIVQGTSADDLRSGPGHYPGTPLPGQSGNAAIAGHRTTYSAPFYDLNEVKPGDPIFVSTVQGRFRYDVVRMLVVSPLDVAVVAPSATPELTLTTCNPRYSASQRLVVQAAFVQPPGASAGGTLPDRGSPQVQEPAGSAPLGLPSELAGGRDGWSGAVGWGLASAGAILVVWLTCRRRRHRWALYLLGAVPVLVLLFLFFESSSMLLPASF